MKPACIGEPYNWHSTVPAEQEACKAICARCPLAVSCEADARARGERWGVWGGANLNLADETADDWELLPATVRVSVFAPAHGRAAYVRGCRCGECTKSNTEFMAQWRAQRRFSPAVPALAATQLAQLDLFTEAMA